MSADTTAIRQSVALSRADHLTIVRVSGDDAFAALDAVLPRPLFLRDGQLLDTVLLDEHGSPWVDLMVARSDEAYLLLADGAPGEAVVGHVRRHAPAGTAVTVESLRDTHGLLSLDGPYAWELLADVLGPDVIGLPYLGAFPLQSLLCLRAGKTGEYGYLLLGEQAELAETWARLRQRGAAYDLAEVSLAALDQCALENAFFDIRREGALGLGPIELQLQWRVSYGKDFAGAEALRARRARGAGARLTTLVSPDALAVGDRIRLDDRDLGRVVNAGHSSTRGDWVALGLLELGCAHPGLAVRVGEGGHAARTVSTPVINNRSLYVNPQRHSYRGRLHDVFPPLVPPLVLP